jgi:hypothetical protein
VNLFLGSTCHSASSLAYRETGFESPQPTSGPPDPTFGLVNNPPKPDLLGWWAFRGVLHICGKFGSRVSTVGRSSPQHAFLITVPTIQYRGYFLMTSLMNEGSGYMNNALRQDFFRVGHAHAGEIVILSLACQILADAASLPTLLLWFVRI